MSLGEMITTSVIVGVITTVVLLDYGMANSFRYSDRVRGTLIHEAIFKYYEPAGFLCNRWIAKSNNAPVDRNRPDCRHHGPGLYAGEVYEIKPIGAVAEGVSDLNYYLGILMARYPSVNWHPGNNLLVQPPTLRIPELPFIAIDVALPLPGVITYHVRPDYERAASYGLNAAVMTMMILWLNTSVGEVWQGFPKPVPVGAGG
jgi:hypothetical protein